MKTDFVLPLLALALLLGGHRATAQSLKVGTVDVKRVFESYDKAKAAEAKMNELREAAKKEFNGRMDVYKKASEDVKKMDAELVGPAQDGETKEQKQKIRGDKAAELQGLELEIRNFQATRQKQLEEEVLRVRSELADEVTKVVADIARAGHFNVVLNKSARTASGIPIVLYSLDEYEFTDDVIKAINQVPRKQSSDSPTGTPPVSAERK